jgi:hypothetical protein
MINTIIMYPNSFNSRHICINGLQCSLSATCDFRCSLQLQPHFILNAPRVKRRADLFRRKKK